MFEPFVGFVSLYTAYFLVLSCVCLHVLHCIKMFSFHVFSKTYLEEFKAHATAVNV